MRLLVDGAGVASHPRLRPAALGLALRGHEVHWAGRGAEIAAAQAPVTVVPSGANGFAHTRADLVIGAGHPIGVAHRGWLAGARCLVHAVAAGEPAAWSWLDRWAWQSLWSFALAEPSQSEALRNRPGPLTLERVGLWSDEAPSAHPLSEHADCEILERACERTLSRHRGGAPRRAAFLDRDGTLVAEVGYLSDPAALRLLPGVAAALARLRAAGRALVVISNQAGVGRGYYSLARAYETMAQLRRLLRHEGVELDAIYFCPHAPDAGCACRKPGIELIERAAEDQQLQARGSAMIGDKRIDVETAQRAGCLGILVETGHGRDEAALLAQGLPGAGPDAVCADLAAAADWLLERQGE